MMSGGRLYQRESWERRIGEIGCGLWPTPRVLMVNESEDVETDGMHVIRNGVKWGMNLATAVRIFPTPQERDWKGKSQRGGHGNTTDCLPNAVGGTSTPQMTLNPVWVDWLMGHPIGWSDLKDSVTRKSLSAWRRLLGY
jgi:hypothetical protein